MIHKMEIFLFYFTLTRENEYFRTHERPGQELINENDKNGLKSISSELSIILSLNLFTISIFLLFSYLFSIIAAIISIICYFKLNEFLKKYENYKELKELSLKYKRDNWISDTKVLVVAYIIKYGIFALVVIRFLFLGEGHFRITSIFLK